jgi:hypothetical protein
VPGIFQRGDKIFLTLAREFFLRCFEGCNAHCDFFPLQRGIIRLFAHAQPFLIRVQAELAAVIEARIGSKRRGIAIERACSKFAVDKIRRSGKDQRRACGLRVFPVAKTKTKRQEGCMAKIDLDSLSIDELAALRDRAIEKLAEKVVARQAELEAEIERISQYGKASKKSPATVPVAKSKKRDEKKSDEVKSDEVKSDHEVRNGEGTEPIADAA